MQDMCPEPPLEPQETQKRFVFQDWEGEYDDFMFQQQRDEEYERKMK